MPEAQCRDVLVHAVGGGGVTVVCMLFKEWLKVVIGCSDV